ncbi:FAE1/Type III polyketide synthase-like protein-domain-containing protein [Haematococcus lacustris]
MSSGLYLLDHACYQPPEECRVILKECEEHGKHWEMFSEDVRDFMLKVFVKSGVGMANTFLPKAIHPKHTTQPINDMASAMVEAEMVMGGCLSELLQQTGLRPSDIDILVTCSSIFCPTPSLASMLVNKFKLRTDIQSYHLGGMGCGTGVVGMNLMRDLLKARPNSVAVFVPAEITTYCFYPGKEKSRMVANVIFRMGGAAIALTNKPSLRARAKYELVAASRVHTGADDDSYNCMSWGPDKAGINGVYLGFNVVDAAGKAIKAVMTDIAPRIMTWGQYGAAAANIIQRNVLGKEVAPYIPDWTQAIDHFALHAGGYAVLKGLQTGLSLPTTAMMPSFAGLKEYGNTSCSTTWYSMAYIETCQGVKKNQRVLQLGVGGGMKAGVNVWRAMRDIRQEHPVWLHLKDSPLTEADLPRGLEGGDIRDPRLAKVAKDAADAAAKSRQAKLEDQMADAGH